MLKGMRAKQIARIPFSYCAAQLGWNSLAVQV